MVVVSLLLEALLRVSYHWFPFYLHNVILNEHGIIISLAAHVGVDVLNDLVLVAIVRASLLVTDKTVACILTLFIVWTSG